MSKSRKLIFYATLLYTLLILYFMFFAFGRGDTAADQYTFIFELDNFLKLPNPSELFPPTLMDLVGWGNTAAFIPFGILIPWLYGVKFVRFMLGFFASILVLETIQALTLLGSFDINDALQNSVGAAIGFAAYSLGTRVRNAKKSLAVMAVSVALLLAANWTVGFGVDWVIAENPGPFVALNEWENGGGSSAENVEPRPFEIGGQTVMPEFNLYGAEDRKTKTYRYKLDDKASYFYLQYGIPDSGDFEGSIRVSVNGQEVLSNSEQYQQHAPDVFEWHFDQPAELTLTLEGGEQAWDVGYRKLQHRWE